MTAKQGGAEGPPLHIPCPHCLVVVGQYAIDLERHLIQVEGTKPEESKRITKEIEREYHQNKD